MQHPPGREGGGQEGERVGGKAGEGAGWWSVWNVHDVGLRECNPHLGGREEGAEVCVGGETGCWLDGTYECTGRGAAGMQYPSEEDRGEGEGFRLLNPKPHSIAAPRNPRPSAPAGTPDHPRPDHRGSRERGGSCGLCKCGKQGSDHYTMSRYEAAANANSHSIQRVPSLPTLINLLSTSAPLIHPLCERFQQTHARTHACMRTCSGRHASMHACQRVYASAPSSTPQSPEEVEE